MFHNVTLGFSDMTKAIILKKFMLHFIMQTIKSQPCLDDHGSVSNKVLSRRPKRR